MCGDPILLLSPNEWANIFDLWVYWDRRDPILSPRHENQMLGIYSLGGSYFFHCLDICMYIGNSSVNRNNSVQEKMKTERIENNRGNGRIGIHHQRIQEWTLLLGICDYAEKGFDSSHCSNLEFWRKKYTSPSFS